MADGASSHARLRERALHHRRPLLSMGRIARLPRGAPWATRLQSTRRAAAVARDGLDGGSRQKAGAVRNPDLRRVHGHQHPVAARRFEPLRGEVRSWLPLRRRDPRRHHPLDGRGRTHPTEEGRPARCRQREVRYRKARYPMKFSLTMPNTVRVKALTQPFEVDVTGADQVRVARRAEELGYDMIPIPEHFIVPNAHVELSGPHYFHSTVAQAFIAGATQRIRGMSTVTLLALQHPVILAKALSTADWMSNGRISVTFGVGWDAEEFKILGVPFHERGRMADEYLAAIVELWTSDTPEFEGKYVSFKDIAFEPKPVQKPHLPVWIGGDAEPALKRAARYASGWFPWLTPPGDIPQKLEFIKSQPTYDGKPFEVLYGLGA